jgi:hypothetical protein
MEISDAKSFVNLVTEEARRREALLKDADPDYAYDQWIFTDLPFLHDLSLLFLVAIRHHVERRLLYFAACATGHGSAIKRAEYELRMKALLALSLGKRWKEIEARLSPTKCAHYASIEALRLLANSYKHDPRNQPDKELIVLLGLDTKLTYATLPESGELQKGLALLVGLPAKAGYAEITERFVEHAEEFLKDVQSRNLLSKVNWGRVSLIDFAH